MMNVRILNPYGKGGAGGTEKAGIRARLARKAKPLLNDLAARLYESVGNPMPLAIEVETINRCNSDCGFCPVNRNVDPREYMKMTDQLIDKIARELGERDYDGLLGLFSNNEPLLDRRIVEICRTFRTQAPRAYIYIYTNGMRLDSTTYTGLFDAGLDELIVDNYDDDLELIEPVRELLAWLNSVGTEKLEHYKSRTTVVLRKKTEVLTNRGGTAPNKSVIEFMDFSYLAGNSCTLPYIQMVIRPSGEISLCCQDATGKVTLGDLSKQSIHEVWNGQIYKTIRNDLKTTGRKALDVCKNCDVTILYSAIPKKAIYERLGQKDRFRICSQGEE